MLTRRVLAYLIDVLIVGLPIIILLGSGISDSDLILNKQYRMILLLIAILTELIFIAYVIFKNSVFAGQSIGKKILKLQVKKDARRSDTLDSFLRNVLIKPFAVVEFFVIIFRRDFKKLGD